MSQDRQARIGRIEWLDLTVQDADQTRNFYEQVVGWTSSPVSMGDYEDHCMLAADDQVVAGVCHARGSNASLPPQWIVYINVDDLEKSLAAVSEHGGQVLGEIRKMPGSGRYCLIADPAGAVCSLFEPE